MPDEAAPPARRPEPSETAVQRVIGASRFIAIPASLSLFIASTALIAYASVTLVQSVYAFFREAKYDEENAKSLMLDLMGYADLYLVAVVLFMMSIGLYQLFVGRLKLPETLMIGSLEALKDKLIGVIVVALGVLFLGEAGHASIAGQSALDLLELGGGIAFVIAALALFLLGKGK
ncbi:MAG: YqhA family protein [Alphaproteobacteria bacterium]